jgi:hypothetical protein
MTTEDDAVLLALKRTREKFMGPIRLASKKVMSSPKSLKKMAREESVVASLVPALLQWIEKLVALEKAPEGVPTEEAWDGGAVRPGVPVLPATVDLPPVGALPLVDQIGRAR